MEDDANSSQLNSKTKWKQRQVNIKTMEGDFSVCLWTTSLSEDETPQEEYHEPEKYMEVEKKIACPYQGCNKLFRDKVTATKHRKCHEPRKYSCIECGRSFRENSKLIRHQLVHSGEKPFICSFKGCGKRFSLDFNLRTHILIHTNSRPYKCSFHGCQKAFTQSANLKSHLLIHYKKQQQNENV